MDLLNFVFRLGVVFAIYGFLWGILELAILLLSAGRKRSIGEVYLVRALKYFFLVDVTFLFCIESESHLIIGNRLVIAGLVLLTYFLGKFQNNQNSMRFFQMVGTGLPKQLMTFHMRTEIIVIAISLIAFILFSLFPQYASNPLSEWFHESIINIEDTPIFGFIFKVIGFFFLINLISKMMSGFTYILSGEAFRKNQKDDDDNDFDDFIEVD